MKIKGEKIYLRKGLTDENYPLLLKWFHDLEVMKYVSWVKRSLALKDVEELKRFIAKLENGIIFGIYSNDDKFIGYSSFSDFNGKDSYEFVVFILDKNYQGRGVGSEVTRLMLRYAFDELSVEKIILSTSEFHIRAIKLYEKIGFKKTELIPNDRTIYHNGNWVLSGTIEMEISRNDFM